MSTFDTICAEAQKLMYYGKKRKEWWIMKYGRAGNAMRWILLGGALVMVVIGVLNHELETVFVKAVNICLECIGIG